MKRITIKDLSELLNVSTSTISRALNDHPDISDATKKRVRDAAESMNYKANLQARFFRKKLSGLIALVLPEMNMFYTPSFIDGVNKALEDSPYSLVIFQSNNDVKQEKNIVEQCIQWAVEGVLIALSKNTTSVEHIQELEFAGIECLLFDKILSESQLHSICIDNVKAAEKGVELLFEHGHRNIVGIFGNRNLNITKERVMGYENVYIKHGLPVSYNHVVTVNEPEQLDFILPFILESSKVTGIFTMSDELLFYTLNNIRRMNLRIPEDMSLVSISDGILPNQSYPKITYVKDSGEKMGKSAMDTLIRQLEQKGASSKLTILSTDLVENHSVRSIDV